MSVDTISAVLATAALAAVLLGVVSVVLVADSRAGAFVLAHAQKAVLAVSLTAMSGSLYYSEVAHYVPCEFCWFQRIAMYPIAILTIVAVITRDRLPARYIAVAAAIGLATSIYHYQLQLFPEQATVCTGISPCTAQWVDELGFVSIPFMAGCGFLAILLVCASEWRARRLIKSWTEEAQPAGALRTTPA